MPNRLSIGKITNLEAGVSTNTTEGMFQGRPFVMRPSSPLSDKQADQNASLQQARKYGHSLNNAYVQNITNTTNNTTIVQPKKDKEKIKKHGVDTIDMTGSNTGVGSAVAASSSAGGASGVLALPAVVNDANDAVKGLKEGDKLKASTSGAKSVIGGAGAGASMAGFAKDAVNEVATQGVGGGASIITGGIDALLGIKNAKKAKDSRREVKDVARTAAEKLSPQGANSKPRTTKELRDVQNSAHNKSKALEDQIGKNKTETNNITNQIKLVTPTQEPNDDAKKTLKELRPYRKDLKKQQKDSKKHKSDLKNQKSDLEKSLDTLDVAIYAADGLDKTKKREIVNATSGSLKAIGGGVTLGEPISGSVFLAAGSILKPGRGLVHKGKQTGRDKGLPGFDRDKTTDIKRAERQDIASKLAKNRDNEEMQKIFGNLPGVNKEQINRFKDKESPNRMSQKEMETVLKRRSY